MKSATVVLTSMMLLQASIGLSDQSKTCTGSSTGRFVQLQILLAVTPVRSAPEFAPVRAFLESQCFEADAPGALWSFSDQTAKVTVLYSSNDPRVIIGLSPHSPVPFGDAALGALIARAASLDVSGGDTLTITLPSRQVNASGRTGMIEERLAFALSGGAWSGTTTAIQWLP